MKYFFLLIILFYYKLEIPSNSPVTNSPFIKVEYTGPHDRYVWPVIFYSDSINPKAVTSPYIHYFKITNNQMIMLSNDIKRLKIKPLRINFEYKFVVNVGKEKVDSFTVVNRNEFAKFMKAIKDNCGINKYRDSIVREIARF